MHHCLLIRDCTWWQTITMQLCSNPYRKTTEHRWDISLTSLTQVQYLHTCTLQFPFSATLNVHSNIIWKHMLSINPTHLFYILLLCGRKLVEKPPKKILNFEIILLFSIFEDLKILNFKDLKILRGKCNKKKKKNAWT